MKATTRDIGFAIRDFLELNWFAHFENDPDEECELIEQRAAFQIEFIDVGDPNNLLIHLDNGQQFRVRIFSEG